jgi:UDP-N-acetylglucosamine 3-dehydrogenase
VSFSDLSVAVIGAGSMGRNHARVYAQLESIRFVAVSDPDESALARVVRTSRARPYTDYRELLDRHRPDLVSIAVPTQLHAEIACDVMQRGIHVLVEKPLALNRHEGERMIETAAENNVNLAVGHVERFNPAIAEIKRRLDDQELGRIFQLHARRVSPFPLRVQDVGVVLDLATHDIDVMRYLIGSPIERLYAETERKAHQRHEDLLSGVLRFKNGVVGVLDVNWLTPTKVRQLSLIGEAGMYVADYLTQDVYWYKNSRVSGNWDSLGVFRDVIEGDMLRIHVRKQEPLQAEIESVIAAIRNNKKPVVSGVDGLAALNIAHSLVDSGRRHEPLHPEVESVWGA